MLILCGIVFELIGEVVPILWKLHYIEPIFAFKIFLPFLLPASATLFYEGNICKDQTALKFHSDPL